MGSVFKIEPLIWVSFWRAFKFPAFQLKSWFKPKTLIQEYRDEIQDSYWTCAWTIWCMFLASTMWRNKNQPSTSTSCSDNVLPLLVLVTGTLFWGLQVTYSFSMWGCVEGLFGETYILKGQISFEGHWRLQSWTLDGMPNFKLLKTLQIQRTSKIHSDCYEGFAVGLHLQYILHTTKTNFDRSLTRNLWHSQKPVIGKSRTIRTPLINALYPR